MIFRIPAEHVFPNPTLADPSGLLGVGGDLSPERLLLAYRTGIFPWYSDGQPILWWSPDPRMVLDPADLRISRSLGKRVRQQRYRISLDEAFADVMMQCAVVPRPGQDGTWLTAEMLEAYVELHRQGHAHSVEAWEGDELVGGLYGVIVGGIFSGESMFARRPDASKVAFVHLVRQLQGWGVRLVDCQVHTPHLERFGAVEVPRSEYLATLLAHRDDLATPARWCFEADAAQLR